MLGKVLIMTALSVTLSGCLLGENITEEWLCPLQQGEGCQTISQADGTHVGKQNPVSANIQSADKTRQQTDKITATAGTPLPQPTQDNKQVANTSESGASSVQPTQDKQQVSRPATTSTSTTQPTQDNVELPQLVEIQPSTTPSTSRRIIFKRSVQTKVYKPSSSAITQSDAHLRTPEQIGTIYFYPFVDKQGNYHQAHVLKKVFVPAGWK